MTERLDSAGSLEHALPAAEDTASRCDHFVQFYDDSSALVDAVSRFVGTGLDQGSGGLMIASLPHRATVAERLSRRGIDVRSLEHQGRWVALDAKCALDRLIVDGLPDERRFRDLISPVLERMNDRGRRPRVRAYGEMVALLWEDGKREAAIQLERLWNQIGRDHSLSLFCAYPMRAFGGEAAAQAFLEICAEHAHVLPSERYVAGSLEQRHRLVTELEQKAVALDAEVARRREVEDLLRRREKELADYLDNAQEPVMDLEPDGRVRWGNPAFRALVGSTEDGARTADDFLDNADVLEDVWGRLLRGEPVRGLPVHVRRADGTVERTRLHSSLLRAAGRAVHMRWFLRRGVQAS